MTMIVEDSLVLTEIETAQGERMMGEVNVADEARGS